MVMNFSKNLISEFSQPHSQALPAKEGERLVYFMGCWRGGGSPRIFPGLPVLSYLGQSSRAGRD